jgi:hypothetical protein
MLSRTLMTALLIGLLAGAAPPPHAHAQQPATIGLPAADRSGWIFNVAPYLWLPSIDGSLSYSLPSALGGSVSANASVGARQYLPELKFAAMIAAEAQRDRFSILTDFIYTSVGSSGSQITSVNLFGRPETLISRSLQTGTSTTLKAAIWTLAGGYTVMEGEWGNLDAIAGFRYLNIDATTDFNLALTLTGPRGNGATFGGTGSLSGNSTIWDGIGGFRGRIRIQDTGLFIPYYVDVGAGGSKLTWQVATGLGYRTSWSDLSIMYRHLSFEQENSKLVRRLSLGGPMLMMSFRF